MSSKTNRPNANATKHPSPNPNPNPNPNPHSQLPSALTPWHNEAFGDERDDIRAALSAGADTADDLAALELAIATATDEESDLDPERRQSALRAAARLLGDRATLLHEIFAYLWTQEKPDPR